MVKYYCEYCDFITNRKSDFERHQKTQKHLNNEEEFSHLAQKSTLETQKRPIRDPQKTQLTLFETQKRPEKDPVETQLESDESNFICFYCDSTFKNKTHLYRHMKSRCKVLKEERKLQEEKEELKLQLEEERELNKLEREHYKEEREKLYKYIEKLLAKTGNTNTTINIGKQTNQSINLNSYGKEDISHITDSMKDELIKLPYSGVSKMIEYVHFNNQKPENRNIAITNKKEKMIKVYEDNKWKYKDKDETLDELIQTNYVRLDDHFETNASHRLSDMHNKRYRKFQTKFDSQDEEMLSFIKKNTEMTILSDNI